LQRYFTDVESLTNECNIAGADIILLAIKYVPVEVEDLWDNVDKMSWDTFKTGVIVYYLSLKTGAQYARSDLDTIVQKWAERGITNRDNLGTYHQEFTLIATYLTTNDKLSLEESCCVFLCVFCRAIAEKLTQKLEIKYSDYEDRLVYNIAQVVAAVGSILEGSTLT
ncbi:uncharacterized protein FOMMEDRAFT_46410, partial [Fomitiporia mediterranea MF3/22]|uniref:uncharacterized protein n=1 Tax=Fomitiporia mediterranea (strain MF3/22) TaxID=694068 RepID=UPI0004408487